MRSIPPAARPLLAVALLLALATPAASAQSGEETMRLYDLRDLAAILPPAGEGEDPPAQQIAGRLCDAVGINHEWLLPDILAVYGADQEHELFGGHLAQVRALYTDRYELEIVAWRMAGPELPHVGAPLPAEIPGERVLFTRQVVTRRQPSVVESFTSIAYVADLTAVTGDNAEGYDPVMDNVEEGVRLEVLVGAGNEDARHTALRVRGEISRVHIDWARAPAPLGSASELALGLPSVAMRNLRSDITIPFSTPTVFAVVNGFEGDDVIVLAAAVRKME